MTEPTEKKVGQADVCEDGTSSSQPSAPCVDARRCGMTLRVDSSAPCSICGGPISDPEAPGQSAVWPSALDIVRKRYIWSHHACALTAVNGDADRLVAPDCKHWRFRGKCSYGAQCMFQHTPEALAAFQSSAAAIVGGTGRRRNRGEGKRNRMHNGSRCFVFRRFLQDTFGLEVLRAGSGVIDVAGGKGELSFELHNLSAVPTTTIDPRVANNTKCQLKWEQGFYSRNPFWDAYHPGYEQAREPEDPRCVTVFFEKPLVDYCAAKHHGAMSAETRAAALAWLIETRKKATEVQAYDEEIARKMKKLNAIRRGEQQSSIDNEPPPDSSSGDGRGIIDEDEDEDAGRGQEGRSETAGCSQGVEEDGTALDELAALLLSCSCVVGMHPDQATEPIVDFCLAANKPFAIVPCCVFPEMFPDRRVPARGSSGGQPTVPVRSYDQFVEYLLAKDPRIRQGQLEFEGRNTVLYFEVRE